MNPWILLLLFNCPSSLLLYLSNSFYLNWTTIRFEWISLGCPNISSTPMSSQSGETPFKTNHIQSEAWPRVWLCGRFWLIRKGWESTHSQNECWIIKRCVWSTFGHRCWFVWPWFVPLKNVDMKYSSQILFGDIDSQTAAAGGTCGETVLM